MVAILENKMSQFYLSFIFVILWPQYNDTSAKCYQCCVKFLVGYHFVKFSLCRLNILTNIQTLIWLLFGIFCSVRQCSTKWKVDKVCPLQHFSDCNSFAEKDINSFSLITIDSEPLSLFISIKSRQCTHVTRKTM